MRDKEIPATIEKKMVCLAIITILAGAIVTRLAGLATLGWVIVAYGAGVLCFAYLFAIAPYVDDAESPAMRFEGDRSDR